MGFFKDSLKKWFYTNNSQAASSDARVPLLTASGEPKGSDTMTNLASVLDGIVDFLCPKNEEKFFFSNTGQKSGVYYSADEQPTGVTNAIYIHLRTSISSSYFRIVICFDAGSSGNRGMYYRIYRSTWSSWYRVTSNILE